VRTRRSGADGTHINSAQPILLASGRTISKAALFTALHSSGWIAFGSIWFAAGVSRQGLLPAAMNDLSWVACGFAVTLGFRQVYRRARAARLSYVSLGLLALSLAILGAPIWYITDLAVNRTCVLGLMQLKGLSPILFADSQMIALQPLLIPFRHWFLFGSTLFIWSSLYFGINAMLDLEIERAQVVRALKLADTARLRALQSQLNPHFLFNALNGIAALIRDKDGAAAAAMVDALGDFLRSMLQKIELSEIVVAEELHFIDQYLQIQRFRFGSRLRASVEADPESLGALIPTLILQPLVENAVRHGVLPREEGGSLRVTIRKRAETLVVSVEDDGPGLPAGVAQSYGVGLGNSADRLSAMYGDAANLSIGVRPEGGGFAVTIQIPFRKAREKPPLSRRAVAAA